MKLFNDAERITVLDERFYRFENSDKYYPSVTTILQAYPKGQFFDQWLKENGMQSDELRDKAGEQGTNVHNMIEAYLSGKTVRWATDETMERTRYTLTEWQMFTKFVEWHESTSPQIEAIERTICSDKLRFGGTIDFVGIIDGKRWLLDWKTSNMMHKTYELQLSAYAKAWNECYPDKKIDNVGILWLNAKTRTVKPLHGIGWQVVTFDRSVDEAYNLFEYTQHIWEEENKNYKPRNLVYKAEYCIHK